MSAQTTEDIKQTEITTETAELSNLTGIGNKHKDRQHEENKSEKPRIPAWLSCDLRLDEIKNKEQYFVISGWINVIWKEPQHTDLYKAVKKNYNTDNDADNDNKYNDNKTNVKNIWEFKDKNWEFLRILDLREADRISYYLPIDARRIFDQLSVKNVYYKDPPYLLYNKTTKIFRTEYHITAALSEHFELFWFPFDKQFLNIKIRWNMNHYNIIHWETGKDQYGIPKISDIPNTDRYKQSYYDYPLRINIVEEIQNDIILHEPWIGLKDPLEKRTSGLRFALIRLRFTRNPMYHATYILFPFFIIVLSGFSVYAISIDDVAERLGVSVTVLLTFTAFQSIISEQLPNTAELSLMDYYTLLAYLLQGLVILSACYPYIYFIDVDYDDSSKFGWVLFVIWIIVSIIYFFGGMLVWFMYKCCDKCCGENNNDFNCYNCYWERRARQEVDQWKAAKKMKHSFLMRIEDNVKK